MTTFLDFQRYSGSSLEIVDKYINYYYLHSKISKIGYFLTELYRK